MLTPRQALQIAVDSFRLVAEGRSDLAALNPAERERLAFIIASNPQTGVMRFQHTIDPNALARIVLDPAQVSLNDLGNQIEKLARGKLCSNPTSPHEQGYPYPSRCPQCGALVL
jgi:hypothetical protein